MVVDDSAVIRGLIVRTLSAEPDIVVAASVPDGVQAITALKRHLVDVIVLDIEMPNMDGLSALPRLLAVAPAVKIVMASTLTQRNAEISLKALSAGAADYLPKPQARELTGAAEFHRDLVEKVRGLGAAARRAGSRRRPETSDTGATLAAQPVKPAALPARKFALSKGANVRPRIIAIGSSTGGPQALLELMRHFARGISQPIVITQHMPPTFTTLLAEHVSRHCGIVAVEAKNGMMLEGGRAYIAPGNFHMTVNPTGDRHVLQLNQDPPENYCRPAVDPMMRSVARNFGSAVLAIILTGMGQDGLEGCRAVVQAGGTLIAQDEATSVVWGMPGAVALAGLCNAVLPLGEIGPRARARATE
jgi:two-component system, chemotaxis family, protein-glutamate methylesterase/glutaminase